MALGSRCKFGAPTFETEVFWKQIYCIEENTYDIVGTFRRPPQCFDAPIVTRLPGNCATLAPLVTPVVITLVIYEDSNW